jgi:endoglucanase
MGPIGTLLRAPMRRAKIVSELPGDVMRRFLDAAVLFGVCSLSLMATGCVKKVNVTGDEVKQSPEGKACPPTAVISDAETANATLKHEGRGGYWYTFSDDAGSDVWPVSGAKGGTFEMSPGGAAGTKNAARMKGKIGTADVVYAGMGLNFMDPKGAYDASKYQGISFWAKKNPGSTANVRLKVPDAATDPDGKICNACFNDFGFDLTLTDDWQHYVIPFRVMKQIKGWGSPHTDGIDKSKIYGMQFQVNEKGAAFDVVIDEIAFTGCP